AAAAANELPAETRRQLVDTLRLREQHEEHRLDAARLLQVEEIQWVAEWTLEYGLMVWDVCCQRSWEPRAAAGRVRQLRALRLWDLVVTRDALRGRKELRREQTPSSLYRAATEAGDRWEGLDADEDIARLGNRDSQRKAAAVTQTPTAAVRPPPVFAAEDTDMEEALEETRKETREETPEKMLEETPEDEDGSEEDDDRSKDVAMAGLNSSPVLGPLEEPSLAVRSRDALPSEQLE
ncbi:hypothetical protein AK830_g11943, partial [Neonectria ditissima]